MATDDGPGLVDVRDGLTAWAAPSQLPVKLTSFVGRQHDLVSLRQRLDDTRLTSLVGPGGIGKTRLALEVARRAADGYADGPVFVDLAPLATPELVVQAVARALGLRIELDRNPHAAVFRFLQARQVLLVLDNCEHLLEACAELVTPLLERCPRVTILVTSREPIGVYGETVWRLGPLDEAAAEQLFIDRARARRRVSVIWSTSWHVPSISSIRTRVWTVRPASSTVSWTTCGARSSGASRRTRRRGCD
jgi:hypothetical protein